MKNTIRAMIITPPTAPSTEPMILGDAELPEGAAVGVGVLEGVSDDEEGVVVSLKATHLKGGHVEQSFCTPIKH